MKPAITDLTPADCPVGTRCLIQHGTHLGTPCEVTVVEWAPSGKFVKLHYATQDEGGHSWMGHKDFDQYDVVEVLPSLKIEDEYLPEIHSLDLRAELVRAGFRVGAKDTYELRHDLGGVFLDTFHRAIASVFRILTKGQITKGVIDQLPEEERVLFNKVDPAGVPNNDELLVGRCVNCVSDVRRVTIKGGALVGGGSFDLWHYNCTNPKCCHHAPADPRTPGAKPPTWFTPFAGG